MAKLYAVLTGDLVGSTPLPKKEMDAARATLKRAAAAIDDDGRWLKGGRRLVRGEPEFFRGDAWQMLLTEPAWLLRAALFLRTSMLVEAAIDTRISIGIGAVTSVSSKRISLSRGEAFTLSGSGLDEKMGSRFRLAISLPKEWSVPDPAWLESVVRLCDSVVVQWQGRQIEAARLLCLHRDLSQAELGEMLDPPVSQQSVAKTLRSAGWYGIEEALHRFEGHPWSQP